MTRCIAQQDNTVTHAIDVPEKEMAKRLSSVVSPKLPAGAIGKCSNALVILQVDIDQDGKVTGEVFLSGFEELRDSAVAAVRQWTYKPYEQHGSAVLVEAKVSVFFLGDGESFPMYLPDGKGGIKGGDKIPLPPGCGAGPAIKRTV